MRWLLAVVVLVALARSAGVPAHLSAEAQPAQAEAPSAKADVRIATAVANRDAAAVRALLGQKVDINAPDVQGTPALHWAIRLDDIDLTRLLLSAGADAKLANRYGVTPLALAVSSGSPVLIRLLLDAGADANDVDPAAETMLMIASRVGVADAVRVLLERGAVVDTRDKTYQQTALMVAIRENHSAIVQMLIERGADVNAKTRTGQTPQWVLPNSVPGFGHGIGIVRGGLPPRGSRQPIPGSLTPLLYAARDGRLEATKLLLAAKAEINQTDANAITPLLMAIVNNRVDVAQFLIQKGADIQATDWYGRTPLWAAIETRNMDVDNATLANSIEREPMLEVIKVLLERGAKVNVRMKEVPPVRRAFLRVTGSLAWVDFTGQTPFLTASLAADLTVMRLLLKHGADPNIGTFEGTTPLMAAAGVNWVYSQTFDEGAAARLEAVKLCHELGNDVNAVNSMGLTALMGAANRGSDDIIRFLVEKGAKLDVKDKEGRTAMAWAEGVFLATHPARPKPSSIALIKSLTGPAAAP
jgi:ankyrin repeat protein